MLHSAANNKRMELELEVVVHIGNHSMACVVYKIGAVIDMDGNCGVVKDFGTIELL